jgi:hypothetical protein
MTLASFSRALICSTVKAGAKNCSPGANAAICKSWVVNASELGVGMILRSRYNKDVKTRLGPGRRVPDWLLEPFLPSAHVPGRSPAVHTCRAAGAGRSTRVKTCRRPAVHRCAKITLAFNLARPHNPDLSLRSN